MSQQPTRVLKRDGREERFDPLQLAESLGAALQVCGEDAAQAVELAESVALALSDGGEATVSSKQITAAVEAVLDRVGLAPVARAFRAHREARQADTRRLRVHTREHGEARARPWDRERLARALMRDRHLESAIATRLARAVERRLIAAGLRHVTGRLVAALSDNECRTSGLRGDSLQSSRIGLDRRELRAWMGADCLPGAGGTEPVLLEQGADPRALIGERLLERFAIEEMLASDHLLALEQGRFDLPGLGRWLQPACRSLRPQVGESEREFWQRVIRTSAECVELQVRWPQERPYSDLSVQVADWLPIDGRGLRLETDQLDLAQAWLEQGRTVRLPLARYLQASRSQAEAMRASGRLILTWEPATRATGPREEHLVHGVGVVNLFSVARAAGPRGDAVFQHELDESLAMLTECLLLLGQRAFGSEHPTVALLPAGLHAAIEFLYPGESMHSERKRRLYLSVRESFAQAVRRYGLHVSRLFGPAVGHSGARLSARDGSRQDEPHAVGWFPILAGQLPPRQAFQLAPCLEFRIDPRTEQPQARLDAMLGELGFLARPESSSD